MKHDRRIHLELADLPSLQGLNLKKGCLLIPRTVPRAEVILEKVRIHPHKSDVFDEILTSFRTSSPKTEINLKECKEYQIRRR